MNFWSVLHFMCFSVYAVLFIYILAKNFRSSMNLTVAFLFFCFALWSVINGHLYSNRIPLELASILIKVQAPGWIFFSSLSLVFVMLYTGRQRLLTRPYVFLPVILLPFALYAAHLAGWLVTCCELTQYGYTSVWNRNAWTGLFYAYYLSCVIIGVTMLAGHRIKARSGRDKLQTDILLYTILFGFVFGSLVSVIMKELKVFYPLEANVLLLAFAFGVVYSMNKLEFLKLTPETAATSIVSAMKDGMILIDSGGEVVSANTRAGLIIGGEEKDIKANFMKKLPESVAESIRTGKQLKEEEITIKNLYGEEIDLIISNSPLTHSGEYAGSVCIMTDITLQRRAELEMLRSEERFRELIDSAKDCIWEINAEGICTYMSPSCSELFCRTPAQITGRGFECIFGSDEAEEFRRTVERARSVKKPFFGLESCAICGEQGKKVYVETNGVPVFGADGEYAGCRGASRNITDRKLAEMSMGELVSELQRSNEELEHFAYVASHDLKEPLRMVSSYVQLLKKKYGEKIDSTADEYISIAAENAKKMAELIDDLLEFSRIRTRPQEIEQVDVREVVEHILSMLKFMINGTGATIRVSGGMPVIRVDRGQMTHLLQNLIENAIKFRSERPPEIEISSKKDDSLREYVFSVKDNGIGINKEYHSRVFEIFQRLSREFEGTGIGLAISKKIAEKHGGRMWVESEGEGKGSEFFFTIPF